MFDGALAGDLARPDVKDVRYVNRGGAHPVKVIFTGHPPVAVQIAHQVRSATGMTHGVRTAEGGRMPPAFTSAQFPRQEKKLPDDIEAPSKAALLGEHMLTRLRQLEGQGDYLPPRGALRAEFGPSFLAALQFLKVAGRIKLWVPDPGPNGRWLAVRIVGSDVLLRTPNAPAWVEL